MGDFHVSPSRKDKQDNNESFFSSLITKPVPLRKGQKTVSSQEGEEHVWGEEDKRKGEGEKKAVWTFFENESERETGSQTNWHFPSPT